MARDYSGQRSQRPGNGKGKGKSRQNRRKPAARPASKRPNNTSSSPPGWVWLLCGLCIGLTVAAGFYMFGRPAGSGGRQELQIATPEAARSGADQESAQDGSGSATPPREKEPRFSFYKMLPNYEVVIPEEEYPGQERKQASKPETGSTSGDSSSEPESSVAEPTTPRVDEPGDYIIQAGSFSTRKDADRRKAEIAMLGVDARIVSVDLASGKTVYRVQSHTIDSSDNLNNLLQRLRKNHIDTLVMRAKD